MAWPFSRMHRGIAVNSVSGQTTVGIDPQLLRFFSSLSTTKSFPHSCSYRSKYFHDCLILLQNCF
ncbi:hypothetical protein AXX17_AT1G32460 [Arabidopsis thaliana]|uniref:Uncharacterized protein n=1 Tax=Arabidopsis thaliana TaxID=3702 RepID=A0A178WK51_ARATH|nr:hypothetical protein AXX17_AT1G32460 [Arabidopsis thaliana]